SKVTRDIKNRKLQSTWRSSEHSYRFPEHTILGEIAACMWGLPVFVLESARQHHDPPRDGEMKISEVVGFATQMAHWILLQPHRIEQPLLDAYKAKLQLSEKDVEIMAEELLSMRKLLKTELLQAS